MRHLVVLVAALATLAGCGAVPGDRYAHAEPITGALVSSDGRTVIVPVAGGGCTTGVTVSVVASAPAVRLRAQSLDVGTHPCAAVLELLQASTTLAQPLGDRQLVDDTTGKPIAYISGRVLAVPTFLPAGVGQPTDRPYGGWTRVYRFPAGEHRAPLIIEESLGSAPLVPSGEAGAISRVVDINGHRATLIAERGTSGRVLIGWIVGGYTILVASEPETTYQRALPAHVVLQVARGLRPPS